MTFSRTLPPDYLKSNNFDLIRLFAASQVALEHSIRFLHPGLLPYIAWLAYLPGVPVFFFISGFLISASWERNSRLRVYALNRFLRIYPGLWAAFLVGVVCALIAFPQFLAASPAKLAMWVAAQLTIGQDWNPSFLRGFGVGAMNGSLWTIPVELSFYVALPLLYWLGKRGGGLIFILTMVAALSFGLQAGLFIYGKNDSAWGTAIRLLNLSPLVWIGLFAVGIIVQRNIAFFYSIVSGRLLFFLLAYAVISVIAAAFPVYPLLQGNLNWMGAANLVLLVLLVLSAAFSFRDTADRVLHRNDVSFGIYIYHMPLVNLLLQKHITGAPGVAMAAALVLALSTLSWFFIEKPTLRLRDWSLHRRN